MFYEVQGIQILGFYNSVYYRLIFICLKVETIKLKSNLNFNSFLQPFPKFGTLENLVECGIKGLFSGLLFSAK